MRKFLITAKILLLSFPLVASAGQSGGGDPTPGIEGLANPLGTNNFTDLVNRLIDWLIRISAPLLVIFVIYGAFQMLTAGPDENKFMKGRKTITYAAVGFLIILIAKGLISVIKEFLGVSSQN